MGVTKFVLALCFMGLTLAPISQAQNSPTDYVAAHNQVRAAIGIGPIGWNDTLKDYAQEYVNKKAKTCELEHSHGPYGENLAMGWGEFGALDAVKLWADERPNYDYESNSCIADQCLHYTQIIWRDTNQIGCASAKCKNGYNYISCNYYPPGNYIGERPY
ncbi:basic form of pathogenesis-related protein 1-like [Mercurialis annua]|uniref:basic form of pathogenesis-related protein 1-like n=1 Tax=Mercurialis annua TaxID=3986 RepID=UPI00215EF86F|nr:basic form of pathogenesis-related protein 1-like [Mercurialis annua]